MGVWGSSVWILEHWRYVYTFVSGYRNAKPGFRDQCVIVMLNNWNYDDVWGEGAVV